MTEPRRIFLAKPRGSCAGVSRAIRTVELAIEKYGAPVYVRHQIVHNQYVVKKLADRGAVFVDDIDTLPAESIVVFSAHGVAPAVRLQAQRASHLVIDATCPLVSKVHVEAVRLVEHGYDIILVGHRDHEEVTGIVGEAPGRIRVVESARDIDELDGAASDRLAWLSQTTLSVDDTKRLVGLLRSRFPTIVGPPSSDICYATQNRQAAVKEIAAYCQLVLVVGSQNSSNAVRLVEIARDCGTASHLVDLPDQIDDRWLLSVTSVGVTSGASVPDILVQDVLARLADYGFNEVIECTNPDESMVFALPRELQDH